MRRDVSFVVIILIWIAFAWRIHELMQQSLWRDEVDAIYFALRPLSETVAMFGQAAQNGPLYFLSLRPWFRVVGSSEFALRFPSALAGTLSIPLIFQVTRLIAGTVYEKQQVAPRDMIPQKGNSSSGGIRDSLASIHGIMGYAVPLVATLFLAINPYQIWYGQEGKMYALIVTLALLSSWFWLQGINRGYYKYWIAYLVTTSIAMYCHLLMVLIIPLHFLWFIIAWPQSKRAWRGYLVALCGLTLPYIPMMWWHWEMLVSSEKRTLFNFVPLQEVLAKILMTQSRGPEHIVLKSFEDPLWLAPLFFLGLAGLLLGSGEIGEHHIGTDLAENGNVEQSHTEQNDEAQSDEERSRGSADFDLKGKDKVGSLHYLNRWRRFGLIISWLLVPIGFIYLISLRQPVFVDRYIIWIAPAAMMVLALGLKTVWRNAAALSLPLTVALLLYLILFWGYVGWQQKTTTAKYDLRSAVTYISDRRNPEELLILQIPHVEYSFRYYSSDLGTHPFEGSVERLGYWKEGLYTNRNNHLPEAEVAAEVGVQMQELIGSSEVVWVIYSEAHMWDQKRFMEKWLDEHGTTLESEDFYHAHVRKYKF